MDLVELNIDIEQRHPWETSRVEIVSELIDIHTNKTKLEILDIGSGDAYVADQFTQVFTGSQSHCVDIEYTDKIKNDINSKFGNENLNLYTNLEDIKSTANIDIVTLLDVIEHVPDDVALLTSVLKSELIDDTSRIFITVPAYQSLFSNHDILLKHYRRYNFSMLQETATKSGLDIIEGGYFYTSLIPPRIVQLLLEKIKKPKGLEDSVHLGQWNGSRLKSNIIKKILKADYRIGRMFNFIGIKLPGLSCYAVCKKSTISS